MLGWSEGSWREVDVIKKNIVSMDKILKAQIKHFYVKRRHTLCTETTGEVAERRDSAAHRCLRTHWEDFL